MKLIHELFFPNHFILLTAPVAAGKTRKIIEFYQSSELKMIFVSPLRALANEVYAKLSIENKNVFLTGGQLSLDEALINFLQSRKSVLVATIELLNEEFLDAVKEQSEKIIFVLDEFHLFYHWGESFRPVLHDRFLGILNTEAPVLALTATMSNDMKDKLEYDLAYHHHLWIYLDFGNQQLFRHPTQIHCFHQLDKKLFYRAMWRELSLKNANEVFIIFCSFRSEVDELVDRLKRMGLVALGCVGGEVDRFLIDLEKKQNELDVIVSTTALSHGVNLPEISKVFVTYQVNDLDFWLQMIGRGGRLGCKYDVFTFDSFMSKKSDIFKNKVITYCQDWLGI